MTHMLPVGSSLQLLSLSFPCHNMQLASLSLNEQLRSEQSNYSPHAQTWGVGVISSTQWWNLADRLHSLQQIISFQLENVPLCVSFSTAFELLQGQSLHDPVPLSCNLALHSQAWVPCLLVFFHFIFWVVVTSVKCFSTFAMLSESSFIFGIVASALFAFCLFPPQVPFCYIDLFDLLKPGG